MITIKDEASKRMLTFPSNFDEVSAEVLKKLTNHLIIPANKVVLCLVNNIKTSDLALSVKGNKPPQCTTLSLIAKAGDKFLADNGYHVGDMAIIADSDLERGQHITINSGASFGAISSFLVRNENSRMKMIHHNFTDDATGEVIEYICTLSFKIIDSFQLVGAVTMDSHLDDPFKPKAIVE